MTASAIPAVWAAAVDRLTTTFASTDVKVFFDMDEDEGNENARSVVAPIEARAEQEPIGTRRRNNTRQEALSIWIGIRYVKTGSSAETNAGAWALADTVAAALVDDPPIAAAVTDNHVSIGEVSHAAFRTSRGNRKLWEQRIELELRCPHARLRTQETS